jgi:hypothetical protein
MRHALVWLVMAGIASADSSGPFRGKPVPSEKLGNWYSYLGLWSDRGLEVEVWRNLSLDREELWYKPSGEAYFVRVDESTYLRGVHREGEWQTDPSVRLTHRNGEWKRTALRVARP